MRDLTREDSTTSAMRQEAASTEGPADVFQQFITFLEDSAREILAEQLTPDTFIDMVERDIFSELGNGGAPKLRYVFATWLSRMCVPDAALQQLQKAEAELLAELSSSTDLNLLHHLVLVLAEQATLYPLEPDIAIALLDRSVGYLIKNALTGPEHLHTSLPLLAGQTSTLQGAQQLLKYAHDDELTCALSNVAVRYGRTLLLMPSPNAAEILEAGEWFVVAKDCLFLLPPRSDGGMALLPECINLAVLLLSVAMSSTTLLSSASVDLRMETILETANDFIDDDSLQYRLARVVDRQLEETTPTVLINMLMTVRGEALDPLVLGNLRLRCLQSGDTLGVGATALLQGRHSASLEKNTEAIQYLREAWNILSPPLKPGHVWRIEAQSLLAATLAASGRNTEAEGYSLGALAECLARDASWESFSTQYYHLALSYQSTNAAARNFFGKLAVAALLDLAPKARKSGSLAGRFFQPTDGLLLQVARWLSESGRLGEALQLLSLREVLDSPATRDSPERLGSIVDHCVTFTALEAAQATVIREIAGTGCISEIHDSLIRVANTLAQLEKRLTRETAELGTRIQRRHRDCLVEGGEGIAILSFLVLNDKLDIFLLTQSGAEVHQSHIDFAKLSREILRLLECVRSPSADDAWSSHLTHAENVYRTLFGPIEAKLLALRVTRLVITATGPLRYLPFCALHNGHRYLVEQFSVVVQPVSQVDWKARPARPLRAAILGASFRGGDGVLSPRELFSLESELDAVKLVVSQQRDAEMLTLRCENFDIDALKMGFSGKYGVVHIASHFTADPADMARSVLWLGDGTYVTFSALLELASGLRMVDLLVLAACESSQPTGAANPWARGSVTDMLHAAGVRSVLAAQWPIADRSTTAFMSVFYEALLKSPPCSKDEALRRAQLALLHGPQWAHPYYWAAFELSGNWIAFPSAGDGEGVSAV